MIHRHDDLKIFFIARGAHLREIQEHGLLLDSDDGRLVCRPTLATDDFRRLPRLDLCLLCVKSYDLSSALDGLRSKVDKDTMLLPLLNGVEICEQVKEIFGQAAVFPACAYVGTHIERPGKVTQRGGTCAIHFGPDPQHGRAAPALFRWLEEARINFHWSERPEVEIWTKYVFIAAFGMVTARYDKTMGEVMASDDLARQTAQIMEEIMSIARKRGIQLPRTIVDEALQKASGFPFDAKTSFQRDYVRQDQPDERALFGPAIVRLGKALGVPTPITSRISSEIGG